MGLTVLSNPTGCSVAVDEGSLLGAAMPVEAVEPQLGSTSYRRTTAQFWIQPCIHECNRSQEPRFGVTHTLKV